MAGPSIKKRPHETSGKPKARPSKKQKKLQAYHSSSSESEEAEDDAPLHLFDSDQEDLENAEVDDGPPSGLESNSDSEGEYVGDENAAKTRTKPQSKKSQAIHLKDDNESEEEPQLDGDGDSEDDADSFDISDSDSDMADGRPHKKSKRNDESAFATSMSKILSSKLSQTKRSDPIVSRSAASHQAARQATDAALEAKARRRLREQKRLALEKGRVRDVLVASTTRTLNVATGTVEETVDNEAETTARILATERRLRKVAQRGVVTLFNAVRAAQVKAVETEREIKERVTGTKDKKKEQVTDMSKKGFLDLIASGGGGLKKGALEEA
jgi:hypothetical protein